MSSNPLFEPSKLPYQAPPFDEIKAEHYAPAFDEGMLQQLKEIEAIKGNAEGPTFENTIVALEMSGRLLKRATRIFLNLCSSNTNPDFQKLEQEYAKKFAEHRDTIYLDSDLFRRVEAIYLSRDRLSLPAQEARLVEYYYKEYLHAGANLSAPAKAQLKGINGQIAALMTQFGNQLLAANNKGTLIVDTEAELDGLSADEIAAAKETAEKSGHAGKYGLRLLNTTQQPLFVRLNNRETRRRLYEASLTRAEKDDDNDTRSIIADIAHLRLRKAKILGHQHFSDWELENKMADTESAMKLLHDLIGPSVAAAEADAAEMQAVITAEGGDFALAPWDWQYYEDKVRRAKYSLDEAELKPYFLLQNVLEKGVFFAAEKLYGVSMKRRTDLPVYHEDVMVYEMLDHDGTPLALYFLDAFARPSKRGGAWCSQFVDQVGLLEQRPVVVNVCNFDPPAPNQPALLTPNHITTLFHEFGHGLHCMFAKLKYPSLAGLSVPRDFVELPSQVNEKWAMYDAVLKNYAVHHETKDVIPQSLVDKMIAAERFGGGFDTLEVVKACLVDMKWHMVTEEAAIKSAKEMEEDALQGVGAPQIPPRYFSTFFSHIFGGGYMSSYYSYLWAKLLDTDAFEWFLEHGGMTRHNGDHFRETVLSAGNSKDAGELYMDFAGRKPGLGPFLRSRGLALQ